MWLIAIIIMSVSPEKGRKMVKPSVVLMACAEWTITLSAFSWFEDNWSSCYLRCIHSHTTVFFRKTNDGCLQDDKRPVRRVGYCFTKQIHELVPIFTILQKSLKIFWCLGFSWFNDILSTAPATFSFSSLCYLQYPLFAPLILTQPPNQRCR